MVDLDAGLDQLARDVGVAPVSSPDQPGAVEGVFGVPPQVGLAAIDPSPAEDDSARVIPADGPRVPSLLRLP